MKRKVGNNNCQVGFYFSRLSNLIKASFAWWRPLKKENNKIQGILNAFIVVNYTLFIHLLYILNIKDIASKNRGITKKKGVHISAPNLNTWIYI